MSRRCDIAKEGVLPGAHNAGDKAGTFKSGGSAVYAPIVVILILIVVILVGQRLGRAVIVS